MATLAVIEAVRTGLNLTTGDAAAAGGGDEFVNTGKVALYVDNAGVGACAVTITTPRTVDGLAVADLVVSVPANTIMLIGPFPMGTFNDGDAKVQIAYDQVVTVTVAVVKVA